ncbi:hypothetical protein [Actinoplanes friuliensis]|uniref:Uncharacterized protein n=1 Tax=Actinoplanes friuliensis DSM 7358 TaxID=1246995 RepID=U5VUG8_9ACTN|nr:hypothetical protein [Actinoplanes friuliensis]AGZ39370.1 hypothetical protein AFR_05405 [Actinoplanes friuliensis DSM 7358]
MTAGTFDTAVQRLIGQVNHWETTRWRPHGDAVFALVQSLADHAADAENRRRRPVPRLADTVLPDQLRVMADDLLAASPSPEVLTTATEAVTTIRRAL